MAAALSPGASPGPANPCLTNHDQALAAYHSQMLALYQPVLSCPWPRRDGPNPELPYLGSLDGLEIDQLPLWNQAIAALPPDPDLWRALAGELIQRGRLGEGLALYRRLARDNPSDAMAQHNLAGALLLCGDGAEAERCWRQSLALDPTWEEPSLMLARLLLDRGDHPGAQTLFASLDPEGAFSFSRRLALAYLEVVEAIARAAPIGDGLAQGEGVTLPEALVPLGAFAPLEALVELAQTDVDRFRALVGRFAAAGQLDRALALLEQAPAQEAPWAWELEALGLIKEDGSRADQLKQLIATLLQRYPASPEVVNAIGLLFIDSDPAAASELFRKVIASHPQQLEALANLATTSDGQGLYQEAVEAQLQALALETCLAALHLNFGNLYVAHQALNEAEICYRKAILLSPSFPEAWIALGNVLHNQRQKGPDLVALRTAYAIAPSMVLARLSLGLALLMYEQFAEGWAFYEARLEQDRAFHLPLGLDKWDGMAELDELVIVAEQGAGDVVQFMRYSILLALGIPRVTILAEPKFHSLLHHYGGFAAVHSVKESYRVMEKSAWYPMASLLGLLGITNDGVIIDTPYLGADAEKSERWTNAMAPKNGRKLIGLNWQGNPVSEDAFFMGRSFPLETYAPLAELEGCQWVSLQKGPGSEQLETCSFRHYFSAAQAEIDQAWDFVETLSILAACDLVITSDTSVAHLAGALGRPTWVLLKYVPDWRWGLAGSTTPWYPTMRLFRQQQANDWDPVIAAVRAALATFLADQP
jgi:tetratricopeptide (TPR) repeat protein